MIPLVAPLLLLMATASVAPREGEAGAAVRPADSGDFVVYETGAGDTLAGLAEAHFRDPADWRRARAANPAALAGMGPATPLAAGTRLRLDTAWLRRTPVAAEIVGFRGDVRILAGGAERPARVGARLHEGDGVATGAIGFVTVRLPDGTEVSLPTSSAIRFDRLRRYSLNGALDRRIRILSGRTTSKVVPLRDPTSRHMISTPVGVAAVRGTTFRVSYTPGLGRASAGVLEGKVGVTSGGMAERLLAAGTGLVFSAAGPGPVTRLPAPPVALEMPALQPAATARFAVRPLPGVSFRATVATDPAMRDPIHEAVSSDGRFAIPGLAAGRYHLEVTAITAEGLEGLPARFSFDMPAAAAADGGSGASGPSSAPADQGPDPASPRALLAGNLFDEGPAELAGPVARLWTEVFGGLGPEEGDSSEGIEDLPAAVSSGGATLWSLGPGAGLLAEQPGAPGWGPVVGRGSAGAGRWPVGPAGPALPLRDLADFPDRSGWQGFSVRGAGLRVLGPPAAVPPAEGVGPVSTPLALAVPAPALVPEPATWAFLIMGFGMVGLGLRARRARGAGGRAGAA